MNTWRIPEPEGELLNILEDISPLEWRRYQQRTPKVLIDGRLEKQERPQFPPYVAFRFERENSEIVKNLKKFLSSYDGNVKWSLIEHKRTPLHGTNWCILPSRSLEVEKLASENRVSIGQYMAQHDPEFGQTAYDDLAKLTEHIRKSFFQTDSSDRNT